MFAATFVWILLAASSAKALSFEAFISVDNNIFTGRPITIDGFTMLSGVCTKRISVGKIVCGGFLDYLSVKITDYDSYPNLALVGDSYEIDITRKGECLGNAPVEVRVRCSVEDRTMFGQVIW